jgi:hypothetical protein
VFRAQAGPFSTIARTARYGRVTVSGAGSVLTPRPPRAAAAGHAAEGEWEFGGGVADEPLDEVRGGEGGKPQYILTEQLCTAVHSCAQQAVHSIPYTAYCTQHTVHDEVRGGGGDCSFLLLLIYFEHTAGLKGAVRG